MLDIDEHLLLIGGVTDRFVVNAVFLDRHALYAVSNSSNMQEGFRCFAVSGPKYLCLFSSAVGCNSVKRKRGGAKCEPVH